MATTVAAAGREMLVGPLGDGIARGFGGGARAAVGFVAAQGRLGVPRRPGGRPIFLQLLPPSCEEASNVSTGPGALYVYLTAWDGRLPTKPLKTASPHPFPFCGYSSSSFYFSNCYSASYSSLSRVSSPATPEPSSATAPPHFRIEVTRSPMSVQRPPFSILSASSSSSFSSCDGSSSPPPFALPLICLTDPFSAVSLSPSAPSLLRSRCADPNEAVVPRSCPSLWPGRAPFSLPNPVNDFRPSSRGPSPTSWPGASCPASCPSSAPAACPSSSSSSSSSSPCDALPPAYHCDRLQTDKKGRKNAFYHPGRWKKRRRTLRRHQDLRYAAAVRGADVAKLSQLNWGEIKTKHQPTWWTQDVISNP
eukprot:GHVT01101237.1.p1 GENE.GHVT01101237.1~~GHVT01101237.1.p1  ORF type:complete len:364 (-),score=107.00 GHVT01101237.1:375-1466(-)